MRVKVIGQNSFLLNLNSFLDKQTTTKQANLEKQSPAIEIEEIKISLVIGQLVFRNKENRVINR